ncbi:hypothetical protein [Mongoliitalea daihaiensis]|uniref:hypothetical protein n=1 Tax=Mongoliitalea daihaiensis TaxID=2782006 RepID=UPI001F3BD78F|nr:hypothetical protein [Mongoliitalea daihaiensis]UJP65906.1 hypothetical protein IPZ59_04595 [Mongoliitalea daihaiensis]
MQTLVKGRNRTNPLYIQKHKLKPGSHQLEIRVTGGIPARAGIDPYNKLIDRIPEDNVSSVNIK